MKLLRLLVSVVFVLAAILTTPVAARATGGNALTCTGGNIPSGSYSSLKVTGFCFLPAGFVRVDGNVTVAPGALLDAMTPAGFPTPTANLPGILQVGGNITVGNGAVLILGCDLAILCSPGNSTYPGPPGLYPALPFLGFSNPGDVVEGNITGSGALAVIVHSVKIEGNATLNGGGGGPIQLTGGAGSGACFDQNVVPFPPNWAVTSLAHIPPAFFGPFPVYSDFEENSIDGNLNLSGLQTCWMGALRNKIGGNLVDTNNSFGDPDANEVLGNIVQGGITCLNNNHAVQEGDSFGDSNIVGGKAIGECGFDVISCTDVPPPPPMKCVPVSVKAPDSQES